MPHVRALDKIVGCFFLILQYVFVFPTDITPHFGNSSSVLQPYMIATKDMTLSNVADIDDYALQSHNLPCYQEFFFSKGDPATDGLLVVIYETNLAGATGLLVFAADSEVVEELAFLRKKLLIVDCIIILVCVAVFLLLN